MGERHSGGGVPGRRHVHPGGTVPAPGVEAESAVLEALLAAALRESAVDAEAEQRAVAAFRATRDARAQQPRTRRRDDWRPREQRRTRRSVKATVAVLLTSLTLGGVAVAGIGSAGSSGDAGGDHGRPSHGATDAPAGRPDPTSHAPGTAASPDHPETAQDTEAHCRAYEAVKDRGKAMEATAWQRLVVAAGGEDKVEAYCAEQLARTATAPADRTGKSGDKGGNAGTAAGSDAVTPAAPTTPAVVPTARRSKRPGR
ncbi:hypothetical protein [Streptomyces sp. NPDC007264]|uniref:hypothetical protein n=1 Tax=Streptomyces sp. NPDC007264 TaxID=3364777 RepID=UPI0036DC038C